MLSKLPKELIIHIAKFVPYICLENDPKIAMLMYHCTPIPKLNNDNTLTVFFDNIIEIAPAIHIDWYEEAYNNFVKETIDLNDIAYMTMELLTDLYKGCVQLISATNLLFSFSIGLR